jgi:hypothetical protein
MVQVDARCVEFFEPKFTKGTCEITNIDDVLSVRKTCRGICRISLTVVTAQSVVAYRGRAGLYPLASIFCVNPSNEASYLETATNCP